MNKFLENWVVDRTDQFRESPPKSLVIEYINSNEYGFDRPPFQNKYRLKAQFIVEFWANQAQYEDELERAKKYFLRHIYGEVIAHLDEISYLVRQGYNEEALKVVERMKEGYKYEH